MQCIKKPSSTFMHLFDEILYYSFSLGQRDEPRKNWKYQDLKIPAQDLRTALIMRNICLGQYVKTKPIPVTYLQVQVFNLKFIRGVTIYKRELRRGYGYVKPYFRKLKEMSYEQVLKELKFDN